ncbi:NADPH-dependent glutamate synthase [bacterium]
MTKQPIKPKEKTIELRISNFDEVVNNYTEEQAVKEAERCLQCKNPVCISGCPVAIDIKKFIYLISQKDFIGAYKIIKEKNNFPSVCGRVCPAEYQCRKECVLTKRGMPFAEDKAINIHFLERFAGDYGIKGNKNNSNSISSAETDKKVAIVGSGPAGLCAAGELARQNIKVTIYESLHNTGGVLRYGIPQFRLPREILDYEIEYVKKLGVDIKTNFIIGRAASIKDLFDYGYRAIFLGLGAGVPSFLNIPGENLCNVYSANEFLTRTNLMRAYDFPKSHTPVNIGKNIIVIGGGNTAMDAARTAVRLQKMGGMESNVTIVYRRTEMEMPARRLEIHHAKEEGIKFEILTQPIEFVSDEKGYVKKLVSLKCELGEPDKSGRKRPVPITDSRFELGCDCAIIAVGLKSNRILTSHTQELELNKSGEIVVNPKTMETSIKNVYAGGDIVGGEGTIIEAMYMGKKASKAILKKL